MNRERLMIPGPIELDPDVLVEMGRPLSAHYGAEWAKFYHRTTALMKRVFMAEEAHVFLLAGPGTSGLDAAIGSTIGDGKKILVATNGFFGDRLRQIAEAYTAPENVVALDEPWGEAIDPTHVEDALQREGDVRAVAVAHCETSTGVLNPVREIADACERAILIVDAVSSLGGAELRFDEWGIGICVAATQKCLEIPPGLAPIAVSPRAWEVIERTESPGWYLSLKTWKRYLDRWGEWHPHPVTMYSSLVQALHSSLQGILEEGLEARWARHERIARLFRRGLENLGFELVAKGGCASPTVTAAFAHERLPASELQAHLREHHRILIAGGLDRLKGQAFRVGHMGPTANLAAILPVLYGIEEALRTAGLAVPTGRSLQGLDV